MLYVFGIIYTFALVVAIVVSLVIGAIMVYSGRNDEAAFEYKLINYFGGAFAALLITPAVVWVCAKHFSGTWVTIFGSLGMPVFGASIIGLFIWMTHLIIAPRKNLLLKFAAAGAFHSSLVMPFWVFMLLKAT